MDKEEMKNVIILKNLPSNLIDEAIMVIKDRKSAKKFDFNQILNNGEEKHKVIQGYMKNDELKKIENIRKEGRKYVIKEAEIILSDYISKIERPKYNESKIKKLEKSCKRAKKIHLVLIIVSFISIVMQIIK